jgi:hypothetical protein
MLLPSDLGTSTFSAALRKRYYRCAPHTKEFGETLAPPEARMDKAALLPSCRHILATRHCTDLVSRQLRVFGPPGDFTATRLERRRVVAPLETSRGERERGTVMTDSSRTSDAVGSVLSRCYDWQSSKRARRYPGGRAWLLSWLVPALRGPRSALEGRDQRGSPRRTLNTWDRAVDGNNLRACLGQ